jgi:hypothetical protein
MEILCRATYENPACSGLGLRKRLSHGAQSWCRTDCCPRRSTFCAALAPARANAANKDRRYGWRVCEVVGNVVTAPAIELPRGLNK